MPSKAQLNDRAQELRAKLSEINASDRPESEKSVAREALAKDIEAHRAEVEGVRRSEELAKSLGDSASAKDEDSDVEPQIWAPTLRQSKEAVFKNLMKHPVFKGQLERARKALPIDAATFEVDVKDATSTNNLVGEGLYGSTGPTAAGQNPFLPGAFGPGILPQFIPGIVEQRLYQLRIADLMPSIAADSPDLTYLTESTLNEQANQVAEGGAYPFSSVAFSRVYEQVGKIANAGTLTDEAVKDAPALYNFFLNRLLEGIERQEEVQLLAGGGVPGVNGLLSRSTGFTKPETHSAVTNVVIPASGTVGTGAVAQTIASLTYGRQIVGVGTGVAPTAMQIAEGIYSASVDIQLAVQYDINAIVMHPLDWETVRLGKDTANQYFGGNFFGNAYGNPVPGNENLWGIPVVKTVAIPRGSILVGRFGSETLNVARRQGVTFQTTNSNGTDFVNGRITVRAEERLGLMVYRPAAFELVQLVNGS